MIKRNKIKIPIVISITFLVVIISITFLISYLVRITNNLESEIHYYLSEISTQGVKSVKDKIDKELYNLEVFAKSIIKDNDLNINSSIQQLQIVKEKNNMKRMGIILSTGEVYTTDKKETDIEKVPSLKPSMRNTNKLFTAKDELGEGMVTIYSTPIYIENTIVGYIFATYSMEASSKILDQFGIGGMGCSYISNYSGKTIISNTNKTCNNTNMEKYLQSGYIRENGNLMQFVKNGKSGMATYNIDGTKLYVNYIAIDINDWYLISIYPYSNLQERFENVKNTTVYLCIGLVILFLLVILYILKYQKNSSNKLYKLAFEDNITGLKNINGFRIDSENILKKDRNKYSMVYFDISGFKYINDRTGYNNGNKVLKHVGDNFKKFLKKDEVLARVSEDRFIALMSVEHEYEEYIKDVLLNRLNAIFNKLSNFKVEDYIVEIIFNVGIYIIEEDVHKEYFNINAIIDKADLARKSNKGYHETKYKFYSDIDQRRITKQKEVESEMKKALENNEFNVYFQPKYDIKSLKIIGAEALVRWVHPEKGVISPGEFIPIFERNGFIVNLDRYIFEKVCETIRYWIDNNIKIVPISVNITRNNLKVKSFLKEYIDITRKYDVSPSFIEIEITENFVIDNIDYFVKVIKDIKNAGFKISMDDFGSGYSCLNFLKDMPIDVLKIDKEFFNDIRDNQRWKKVVAGVVELAKNLDIEIVSEGIETSEQLGFLKEIGCDMAQGYLFQKPMPSCEFENLLKKE